MKPISILFFLFFSINSYASFHRGWNGFSKKYDNQLLKQYCGYEFFWLDLEKAYFFYCSDKNDPNYIDGVGYVIEDKLIWYEKLESMKKMGNAQYHVKINSSIIAIHDGFHFMKVDLKSAEIYHFDDYKNQDTCTARSVAHSIGTKIYYLCDYQHNNEVDIDQLKFEEFDVIKGQKKTGFLKFNNKDIDFRITGRRFEKIASLNECEVLYSNDSVLVDLPFIKINFCEGRVVASHTKVDHHFTIKGTHRYEQNSSSIYVYGGVQSYYWIPQLLKLDFNEMKHELIKTPLNRGGFLVSEGKLFLRESGFVDDQWQTISLYLFNHINNDFILVRLF